MKEYKKGDIAYHIEDGDVLKVKVLENQSDEKFFRYKLEVIELIKSGPIPGTETQSSSPGDTFICDKLRDAPAMFVMWELSDSS
jgi:hypothetical protein